MRPFPLPGASRTPVSAVVGVIVVALVLGAMAWALPLGHERPPVALIGDSITWGATDTFRQVLGDRWALTIDGKIGYRVGQQFPAAAQAGRLPQRQVVINLGTNDVTNSDEDIASTVETLRGLLDTLDGVGCIHLVTVNERIEGHGHEAGPRARTFNQALRDLAAQDPRIDVIEWSDAVAAWEAANPGRTLTSDSIHPNDDGNTLLASLYRDALERCGS